MTRRRRAKQAGAAGFALFELLAAVAILALLISLAAPLLRPPPSRLQLEASVRKLCATLRGARARAIESNSETAVAFDLARKSYFAPAAMETFLPPQTHIDLAIADSRRSGEQRGDILFFPSGATTGGEIALSLGGKRATVEVNWLTGGARCDMS